MQRSRRRLLALIIGLIAFLIVCALLYEIGMARIEGKPRTFWESLEWAAESLSTTGYGYDSHWSHPAMVIFVIVVQFAGVFFVFLIVPIFLVPFLEERFEERLPRKAPNLSSHIVVYRFGPPVETLLQRLDSAGVPSLVVETDEAMARTVWERKREVVFSRAEEDALDACRLMQARALVANGRDEENAAIILRARQMGFAGEIFAFVEEPAHRKPMELAGATAAFTPRHIIAAALAAHVSDALNPRLPGFEEIAGIERREVRIPASSPFLHKTLAESPIARCGAIVVGQWWQSQLLAHCDADMRMAPDCILELAGDRESLNAAVAAIGGVALRREGPFLVAGFGEVGRKVFELLTDAGEEVRVVERALGPGVDVAGNVLDPSVLARAGIAEARAIVLALNSDDATLFATVIARDCAADVAVIARVNHARNLDDMHRAGADYALSISDVSGQMLSARLLGRGTRIHEAHRQVRRISGEGVAGRRLGDLALRAHHGCSVVAIERAGATLTRLDAGTVIEAGDFLYICGPAEGVRKAMAGMSGK
ncbi:MAG TPA: NAD-binding protein [Thermoanaerobaculia bacterium]|nr:NAD-binding protein [Thermoanaerobaculia bacterium]